MTTSRSAASVNASMTCLSDCESMARVNGARDRTYASGVICAKFARSHERIRHPDWLTRPLRLVGPKGGQPPCSFRVSKGDVEQPGNERGRTRLHTRMFEGVRPGVLVSLGIWPPSAFLDRRGIKALVGDDCVAARRHGVS